MLKVVQDAEASNENTASSSLLDEIVRDGARPMLATALQAEVIAYVGPCGNSPDRHLPVGGGAAGSCTVTRSPPAARGVRVRVPSCAWVMLWTIARPRPTPAWSVRMRSVPRRNGSTSVETNCGVSFSPVFSTLSTTLLG